MACARCDLDRIKKLFEKKKAMENAAKEANSGDQKSETVSTEVTAEPAVAAAQPASEVKVTTEVEKKEKEDKLKGLKSLFKF